MVERARLEIVYVLKKASRVRIPLSPPVSARWATPVLRRAEFILSSHIKIREADKDDLQNLSGLKRSSRGNDILYALPGNS